MCISYHQKELQDVISKTAIISFYNHCNVGMKREYRRVIKAWLAMEAKRSEVCSVDSMAVLRKI